MKTATLSILAITAAPAATFFLGLTRLSAESSFALATSLAITAFALDALSTRPARSGTRLCSSAGAKSGQAVGERSAPGRLFGFRELSAVSFQPKRSSWTTGHRGNTEFTESCITFVWFSVTPVR